MQKQLRVQLPLALPAVRETSQIVCLADRALGECLGVHSGYLRQSQCVPNRAHISVQEESFKAAAAPAAAGPQLLRLRMLWGFSGSRVITAPGMGNFGTSALLLGNTDVWRN